MRLLCGRSLLTGRSTGISRIDVGELFVGHRHGESGCLAQGRHVEETLSCYSATGERVLPRRERRLSLHLSRSERLRSAAIVLST